MKVELELNTKEEILAFNGFCQKLMSLREKAKEKEQALRDNPYPSGLYRSPYYDYSLFNTL